MKLITIKVKSKFLLLVFIASLAAFLMILEVLSVFASNDNIKIFDNASRVNFIHSLGVNVSDNIVGEKEVVIPQKFNDVYLKYNEIQKAAGYDLSLYAGKTVKIYKYEVENFRNSTAYVNLYVFQDCVIGGDISSAELSGFILPLKEYND